MMDTCHFWKRFEVLYPQVLVNDEPCPWQRQTQQPLKRLPDEHEARRSFGTPNSQQRVKRGVLFQVHEIQWSPDTVQSAECRQQALTALTNKGFDVSWSSGSPAKIMNFVKLGTLGFNGVDGKSAGNLQPVSATFV